MSDENIEKKETQDSQDAQQIFSPKIRKFDINRFYGGLRKLLIWGVFFLIIYLLRDLFALVFFTFILGFINYRINEFIAKNTKIARKVSLILIYIIMIFILTMLIYFLGPKIIYETKELNNKIPELEFKIKNAIENFKQNNPGANQVFKFFYSKEQLDYYLSEFAQKAVKQTPIFVAFIFKVVTTIILSIIFSFLILLDLTKVVHELKRFESTRVRDLYNELARPIVRFGRVVGLAFEAQGIISIANTILTCLGMIIIGINEVVFLSIIVFIAGFIPVLGVFISSVPIVLVAFNTGGLLTMLFAIIMVIIVHAIEAYVLNPRIYAAHMKINPVFVLIVLFIGHHLFGVWGMLLGVPVIFYFMNYIAGLKSKLQKETGGDSEV